MVATLTRQLSVLDKIIIETDVAVRTLLGSVQASRANPGDVMQDDDLTAPERKHSAGYMRVDHAGEVCAQALYRGQMCVAKSAKTYAMLEQACVEEQDHLAWTHQRLQELKSHRSFINIFWYGNSFMIGMIAGLSGDAWSLGFIEETEHQVTRHLESHLQSLSSHDHKSRAILEQMRLDEIHHGESAHEAGGKELPYAMKKIMALQAKVLTTLAIWI